MLPTMETRHRIVTDSASALTREDDSSVDLLLTSPPYPMIEMWDESFAAQSPDAAEALRSGDGGAAFEAMHRLLDTVWGAAFRLLRPGGFACVNIGDATRTVGGSFRLYTNHARVISACERRGFTALPPIIWRKQTNAPNKFMGSGMLPAGAYVTLEHEYILIFRKGEKRRFSGPDKERRRRSAIFWEERNSWYSDLWDLKGTRQLFGGSASPRSRTGAFPLELAFRLVNMYSVEGDTVLDPFLGTGTTTIAALAAARNSVGYEREKSLEPVIDAAVDGCTEAVNGRQSRRLREHLDFLETYRREKGREPGYRNREYAFPVVTRQEVEIVLPELLSLREKTAGVVVAEHRRLQPIRSSDTG